MHRILYLFLTLLASPVSAESLTGRVAEIVDGDTLRVELPARSAIMVRLAWIDAPERLQDAGEASRSSLGALASGQEVRLDDVVEIAGGLRRATVWVAADGACRSDGCPKTLDAGLAQVARGMAWHDRRTLGQPAPALGQYEQAEFMAKARRAGLWAGKNPVPPWVWRGGR